MNPKNRSLNPRFTYIHFMQNYGKLFTFFCLAAGLILSGCTTAKFVAVPTEGATVTPGGMYSLVEKEGVAISVTRIKTPYSIRRITTFHVEIYNQTGYPVEFFPKSYLLFDQRGTQIQAMGPDALAEAAFSGSSYFGSRIGIGYGHYGHYRGGYSYYSYRHHFPHHYTYYSYGRSYGGMIGRMLPFRPITIHPKSKVGGNIYFAVKPSDLSQAKLFISRFNEPPLKDQPLPHSLMYEFLFDVVK